MSARVHCHICHREHLSDIKTRHFTGCLTEDEHAWMRRFVRRVLNTQGDTSNTELKAKAKRGDPGSLVKLGLRGVYRRRLWGGQTSTDKETRP